MAALRASALRVGERRPRDGADTLAVLLDDRARCPRIGRVRAEGDEAALLSVRQRRIETGLTEIARVVVGHGDDTHACLGKRLEPTVRSRVRQAKGLRVDVARRGFVVRDDRVRLREERSERSEGRLDGSGRDEARSVREDVTADDDPQRAVERRRPRWSDGSVVRSGGEGGRRGRLRAAGLRLATLLRAPGERRARDGEDGRLREERARAPRGHVGIYPTGGGSRPNLRRSGPRKPLFASRGFVAKRSPRGP